MSLRKDIVSVSHRRRFLAFVICVTLFLFFGIHNLTGLILDPIGFVRDEAVQPPPASRLSPREQAANSTLGFQQILAVSTTPSWRTRGLEAAANLTGLAITVPPQPPNPDALVDAFRQMGASAGATLPQHGSARAWMAHLDLLRFVVASRLETAFIVEDDVDWDVAVKAQMHLVSDNVRAYTGVVPARDTTPFGSGWDVLWLGHCGALVVGSEKDNNDNGASKAPVAYADDTRVDVEHYSGWTRPDVRANVPAGHRLVQDVSWAVCTFGYGVTRQSAPEVLRLLATGAGEAFDVMLSAYCRAGQLRCLAVNPQVFNHYEPPKSDGYVSLVNAGDGRGRGAEPAVYEDKKGSTGNIVNSARCAALFREQCVRPGSDI